MNNHLDEFEDLIELLALQAKPSFFNFINFQFLLFYLLFYKQQLAMFLQLFMVFLLLC